MAAVTGTFSAAGVSPAFEANGAFTVSIWGAFGASVSLQRSPNKGADWLQANGPDRTGPTFNVPEPVVGTLYRLSCTGYVSGTVNYSIGL
jgi:hypothetical protein